MPINIPNALPAVKTLESENIFVMTKERAEKQDIRPLKILILNLMPKKIETETQLLRLLSNSPLQVDIDLLKTGTYTSKNTSQEHLLSFYKVFDDVRHDKYDGMIITGAPVEHLPFEEVAYWNELCEIMAWSKTNVFSVFHICWSAQAGLYYHYGIDKVSLPQKMFGVFPHEIMEENHPLLRGLDEIFPVPHSRHTDIPRGDVESCDGVRLLSWSKESGVHIVGSNDNRQFFVTGHSEYDRNTLADEFFRDQQKGLELQVPKNYFPDDNPDNRPVFSWRSSANLLFSNWLNYCVYQSTPFDLSKL